MSTTWLDICKSEALEQSKDEKLRLHYEFVGRVV
jgi:hypothetical protein